MVKCTPCIMVLCSVYCCHKMNYGLLAGSCAPYVRAFPPGVRALADPGLLVPELLDLPEHVLPRHVEAGERALQPRLVTLHPGPGGIHRNFSVFWCN